MNKKKIIAISLILLSIAGVGVGYATNWGNKNIQVFDDKLLFVSGTEYAEGEAGSTIIRVTNGFGGGITANWCNETIYFPNKTVWVSDQAMATGGASGSWYYDFIVPYVSGIYEQHVVCGVPLGATERQIENSKAFHVSEPLTLLNETESAKIHIIS